MTKRLKRIGAFMLALAMSSSLVLSNAPALAVSTAATAAAATTEPNKPKLVMDFLGDNKAANSYYDHTNATGGGVGSGALPTPEDSDQAWQSTADDGSKWNGYVGADVAPNTTDSDQTVFWIGIGIQDVDKFVLSNQGNGLYSAEIALYYNPEFVTPYDNAANDGALFKSAIEDNMLGATGKKNQWPSGCYKVVKALTNQNMLTDPNDSQAQGDFAATQYGFTEGYGTEELYGPNNTQAPSTWRMAYVSVEMTADQLASTAWLTGAHNAADTYYIAMVPFVLRKYDPQNKLCIHLARNASDFSIGSKKSNGMGRYADGDVTFGNWDKYTFHDPEHDLKLMLDYTGDLNIFTNQREINYFNAHLGIINPSNDSGNKAQMIINNEPFTPPSQIADAHGEDIVHLTGGEELRVSAKTASSFYSVTITVVTTDDQTPINPVSITAVNPWTKEWTFLMPSGTDVDVTVTFSGDGTQGTVELEVIDNNYNEPNNTAKLTAPGGLTTQVLTTGTDTLGNGVSEGTLITVSVTRNSDYNVIVTLILPTGSSVTVPTLNHIVDQSTAQTYTFLMPLSDIKVQVKFELKTPHKATLALEGNVPVALATQNWAKMGYTDGQNVNHETSVVTFANPQTTQSSTPGLANNQIQSSSGRSIYIDTGCSPEYEVSSIKFRKGDDTPDHSISATLTATPGRYVYTMPDYEIKVIVVYERVKTYRVRLVFDDNYLPDPGEGATLNGTDARGTYTLSLDEAQYAALVAANTLNANNLLEVFGNASMGVSFFHVDSATNNTVTGLAPGRTAEIKVYYPEYPNITNSDIIIPSGSAGSGFSFPMQPLQHPSTDPNHTDAVYVVVSFKAAPAQSLIARIYNDRPAGVSSANANATWAGIAPGHNNPINVYENDQISVSIRVDPGVYIISAQVYDEGVPPNDPTYVGAPLGVPVTLTGIGYNNGQGGTETASFTMPNQNATLVVKYGKGAPPEEPAFTATIRKAGNGDGTISIKNATTNLTDTHTSTNARWVDATTGDQIAATYKPNPGSYVSNVTVTAAVPGTTVNTTTTVNADGSTTVSVNGMPSSDVVIEVTFTDTTGLTPYGLTLTKTDTPSLHPSNTVTVTPSGPQAQVGAVTTATTTAYEGEVITAVIQVDAGWHIVSAEATLDADGSTISVTPSGNGYNNGVGGTETATFQMPAGAATLKVEFAQGAPANTITLKVDDPANKPGNTATLYLDGTPQTPAANSTTSVGPLTAAPGTVITVVVTEEPGYSVDLPILYTPSGVVSETWTAVDTFEFTMPNEPLTVTVPFLTDSEANDDFYANLIFRDGDGQSAAGVAAAKGTFLDMPFTNGNYANQLNGTLRYSRTAQPGEDVPFAVRIPDGYYISDVTVTPANFGVEPTITGMIATQRGEFLMPAGNVMVNVYLAKGWPDEARYHVTLHVEGPNDQSTATLKSVTDPAVTPVGPLPVSGQSSGSGFLTALDGDKMRVTLNRDPNHDLASITILDGNENPVSYQWATDGGYPAVEFNVPGSSVDVYVKYTDQPDGNPYTVDLHVDPGTTGASASLSKNGVSMPTTPFNAQSGDDIGLTVTGTAPSDFITYAYAVATDAGGNTTMVSLGDPALAGTFVNAVTGAHGFIMPFHVNVDVYIGFTSATQSDPNQYSLTLQVNGDAGSGSVTVSEYDTNNVKQQDMSATAVGGAAMLAHSGNRITAEVSPATGYALYSLIAYKSTGERVNVSLAQPSAGSTSWNTYTFTMPEDTTHIEAEFRRAEPAAYQIQVVVNNTANNGAGNNDAFLYEPPGALQGGFKFRSGVDAGTTFDLGFIVDTGYQVESIVAVPQGSGVAANVPLPATSSGRTQVTMPASDLVIYVTFRIDNTTRYNVTGVFDYMSGVTPPPQATGSNVLRLEGSSGQNDTLISNDTTPTNAEAQIQEAQGGRVEAKWTVLSGYVVSSYTVETTSGQTVLSQPNATNDGCFFYMPAAPVKVTVELTKPEVTPPTSYTATLHYLQGSMALGDQASISFTGPSQVYSVNYDTGVITNLHVGDQIDIAATPGPNRYLQTIYVLQSGPTIAQNGQTLPLQHSNLNTTTPASLSTGDFYMPSGNVDVYVVFNAQVPTPGSYMATVKVNSPGGVYNTTNFAEIFTVTTNSNTAYCNGTPASIVATQQSTVTVRVTVDSNHEIVSVTGTPITPTEQPQMGTGATNNGVTVYTFTMPANNASVIVNLREKQTTKYKLYLHVTNQFESTPGELDLDNETVLAYGSPVVDSLVRQGAAPTQSDVVIPHLATPGGSQVTLTVRPQAGYFVRAAYVVYDNGLVQMTPATLPNDYSNSRTNTGLEGTTPIDIGVPSADGADKPINTATFTMPNANADVYVVYEKGPVPTTPWYNVVVIATDSGDAAANAGHGRVKVSSSPFASSGTAAIDPAVTVPSVGQATYFYSVPYQETIRLDASDVDAGYEYDISTGMVLTYQTPGATAAPPLTQVDLTNHPRGELQTFGMPLSNVGVHIHFVKAGTTGLWAQLHVVQADGIPGYSANTVTMSTGAVGTPNYRAVDNHELTAVGPTGGASGNPDTTNNMILRDLTSQQLISTLIHPRDSATRVVQVTVTQVDQSGNVIGSAFATHAGDPTDPSQDWYNYIMGENNVHIYVVLAKRTDTDRFVAVAMPSYDTGVTAATGGTGPLRNEITGLTNTTTAGLSSADYWTEIKAQDRVKVSYTAQVGVYVNVKAYRAGTSIELPNDPIEFGVGNGSAGYAYVDVPDPCCDVEIVVEFSNTPPTNKTVSFVSHDHGGKPANETALQKEDPANPGTYIALSGTQDPTLTPTSGTLTDITWPTAPATHSEMPGTKLKVLINSLEPGYEVAKVEVAVGTSFTIEYHMREDTANPGTLILVDANDDPVNLVMPNGDTVITVHFKEVNDGLIPYDPRNENSNKYDDHWIRAENRGDYLIVTVPHLNNANDTNRTSVTWTDAKKDRFKFYLDQTSSGATTPVYTSVDYILKRSRPTDAPAATGTEPYWMDNFLGTHYGATTSYIGAQFVMEVMTDKEIDDDNTITNKTTAKTLAATLRKIIDNDGTKSSGDTHSLYISCEETTYKADGTVDKQVEGDKVDFEIPRYYSLVGILESYAPTHIATFTLTDEAVGSKITFDSTMKGSNGVDLWQQDFKVKLTSDYDGKLKNKSFTLTIEKAGHITYTRTTISLDNSATAASSGTYDDTKLSFKITDPIRLFCGDLDDNGFVEQRDVQLLIAVTMGYFPVSKAETDSDTDWGSSVYNPATTAYAADLNGDGEVDVRDMNIALSEDNYGRSVEDYGVPTGLTMATATMFMMVRLPEWYINMLKIGREIPQWAEDLASTGVDIPNWAVTQALMGREIPQWAVELIENGEELPQEAMELLKKGKELPQAKPVEVYKIREDVEIKTPAKNETNVTTDQSTRQDTAIKSPDEAEEEDEAGDVYTVRQDTEIKRPTKTNGEAEEGTEEEISSETGGKIGNGISSEEEKKPENKRTSQAEASSAIGSKLSQSSETAEPPKAEEPPQSVENRRIM